jgi:hypothetical protein
MSLRVLCIIIVSGLFCLPALTQSGKSTPDDKQKSPQSGENAATPATTTTPLGQGVDADHGKDVKTNKDWESEAKSLQQSLQQALGLDYLLRTIGGVAFALNLILAIWISKKFHDLATSGNVDDAKKEIQKSLQGLSHAIEEVHTIKTELQALRTDQLPQILNTVRTALDQTNAVQSNLTATRTDLQNSLAAVKTDLQTTLQTLRSDVTLARGEAQTTLQILRTEVAALKNKGEQQGD